MAITLTHVSKFYGRQKALDDLTLNLQEGEICGFLGPNGAGKSTTMKILTGYLTDYEGEVNICGLDLRRQPIEAKAITGYLPEHNPLYPDLYIGEYLLHVARLYRLSRPLQRVREMIDLTGLGPEMGKKIGQLSKGYRQRVGLAQALIHDPRVLVLDEPMTGLDPNQLEEIRHLIAECGKNKTILLSTHIMQEVEALCRRVVILDRGTLVADRPLKSLQENTPANLRVSFAPGQDTSWLEQISFEGVSVQRTAAAAYLLRVSPGYDPRIELFGAAAARHCPIIELRYERPQLEQVFHQVTQAGETSLPEKEVRSQP